MDPGTLALLGLGALGGSVVQGATGFGFAIVARDRARRSVEPFVVAPHQQLEQCRVAVEHGLDDPLVALLIPRECGGDTLGRSRFHHLVVRIC